LSEQPGLKSRMKKILIIEDDQIVANVYRNKLAVEGYQVEIAPDGETGLKMMRTFKPDMIVLDLMLPKFPAWRSSSRSEARTDFAKTPIIVFSNTYLTNLIQEAWKAGAKNVFPRPVARRRKSSMSCAYHRRQRAVPTGRPAEGRTRKKSCPSSRLANTLEADTEFQADLQKSFTESLPATLATARSGLQGLMKENGEVMRLKQIYELYRRSTPHRQCGRRRASHHRPHVRFLRGPAQGTLREAEKHQSLHPSHVANAVDFLGFLFERGIAARPAGNPRSSKSWSWTTRPFPGVPSSMRSTRPSFKSVNVEDPNKPCKLLTDNEL
jgi:DNA-binding response OmpR family regulator